MIIAPLRGRFPKSDEPSGLDIFGTYNNMSVCYPSEPKGCFSSTAHEREHYFFNAHRDSTIMRRNEYVIQSYPDSCR